MDRGQQSRVYRAEAVVLRRVSTGETDRVLTLFTRDKGKISAIAKGARGPKSRMSGATEPFTYFHGLLALGQTLDVLTQAEVQDAFPALRKDLDRVGYASYFVEVVDAGLEERQPLPELWELLVGALGTLTTATSPDVLARAFELGVLTLLGYEPHLDDCALDGAPVTGEGSAFHPLKGGMLCPRCARMTPGTLPVTPADVQAMHTFLDAPLVHAANSRLPSAGRQRLARCLIPFVRHHLETPLRSLQFLDSIADAPDLG